MADLLLLCVLLLVAGTSPAPLQELYSITASCADKLVSFSPCISSSPINISGSSLIQCCDNFAVAIDYNTAICLYYLVHNPPILGLPINSMQLRSFSQCISSSPNNISGSPPIQCCDDFAAAFNDNSAIRLYCLIDNPPIVGFPINSTKLMSLASDYHEVKEKEGEESLSLESQFSAGLSSSPRLPSYYCWLLCAALVCHYVEHRDYRSRRYGMPHLEEANVDNDAHEIDDVDAAADEIPHVIPIYRWIENVDILVATVDIIGCFGFTSFSEAVKLSHPDGGDDWHECVLWPWRGDRMDYMTQNGQVLNPLENTWIEFTQQLFFIRVTVQEEEPTIGLLLHEIGEEDELVFDVLLPRRYANVSTSFAVALHYIWSAWSSVEPFPFDHPEQINIALGMHVHIQYFSMNNLPLVPPPLLPLPANIVDWIQFTTALSYISILDW